MKKRILTMLVAAMVCVGILAGCTSGSTDDKVNENASVVRGEVEVIKDFMFIVTDDNKVSYAFTFEKKPEGLDEISAGDRVIVKYTGTISEIDPFMGKILSVEKESK